MGAFASLRMTRSKRCGLSFQIQSLYASDLRLPDEFVELEAEAGAEIAGEHPFGEVAWIEQAVFRRARPAGVLAEGGREDEAGGRGLQGVGADEVAGVVVVGARGEDELQLVATGEGGEVLRAEAQMLAAGGGLDIDGLMDLGGAGNERALAAGFQQHLVVEGEK